MTSIILTACLAALLSSVGTLLLANLLFAHRYRSRLEEDFQQRMHTLGEHIEDRVKTGVTQGIVEANMDDHLAAVEAHVRDGVKQAANDQEVRDLLDQWTDEIEQRIRQGIVDGVADIARPETIRDATINVTETGTSLLADGLNSLLGGVRPRPDDKS